MIKKALFSTFILIVFSLFTSMNLEQEISDYKYWSEEKLTYDDFKGQPDAKSKKPAESKFMVDILDTHLENNIPKYNVRSFLKRNESWMVLCDETTLSREQLVFDMHEISARKIRKAFDSLNKIKMTEAEIYQIVFEANIEKAEKQIDAFILESASNPKKQKIWQKKITSELTQLQAYASK